MTRSSKLRVTIVLILVLMMLPVPFADSADEESGEKGKEAHSMDIMIKADPQIIFPYLIVEDQVAKWKTDDSVIVTFPNGIEPRVGKLIRVAIKMPKNPWILLKITELDVDKKVTTEFIDGFLSGSFIYRLEPKGPGKTLLVHEMRISPEGAIATAIWETIGKRIYRRKMRSFIKNMKQVIEADIKSGNTPPPFKLKTPAQPE